jgi:acyl transferase domain-containing protein/acyl-CoA synthetase (AMP-forming)/AMP-acid ligase II/pimeloyl-ACP methyl ester carboxylesterase/acyl carrier protein
MGYVKHSNFVNLLQERAISQPNKVIFTFLGDGEAQTESLTYQQLDNQAKAIAVNLSNVAQNILGKKAEGERALLLYQPGLEFITAFLGCLYAGIIATPAYPPRQNRSFARLDTIIKDAGAIFALTTESLKQKIDEKLTQNSHITCIPTDNIPLTLAENWQQSSYIKEDNLAFLQYTSGSTGTPKGVMVSHGNLIHNSYLISSCFENTPQTVGCSWLPPYHDMGLIGGILQPIYAAITTILLPPVSFLQRPIRWLRAISKYKVTTTGGPNFAYEMCVNSITEKQKAELDLSSWDLAFSGAEPVRQETITKFSEYFADCGFKREAFLPCYGMAETTLIVSGGNKHQSPTIKTVSAKALTENKIIPLEENTPDSQALVSSGKIAQELQGLIVNPDNLTECNDNEVGEIWIKGASVTQGYWQREEVTENIFHAYTKDTKLGPFLRTGDLGFISEGELFVTGRLKDLIIIRGRNHYPQDIEESIANCHEAINSESGAAFAIEVEKEEQLVVTFEVKRTFLNKINQDEWLKQEIFKQIRQTIAENHELQVYSIVLIKTGSIPKTSSGKIARYACRQGFLDDSLSIVAQWDSFRGGEDETRRLGEDEKNNYYPNLGDFVKINLSQESGKLLEIQTWLKENIANRLGVSPQTIDISQPFINYGLDSLQAVRLTADLEDWLDCRLSSTLAYDYPSIAILSAYLAQEKTNFTPIIDNDKSLLQNTKVAIIGMACRFPKANNCEEYWQLLSQGKSAIRESNRQNLPYLGGYIDNYDQFDPHFFEISPREALNIDPQQRILLQVSHEALENANLTLEDLSGSDTGVFIGISSSDYAQLQVKNGWDVNVYTGTGNASSISANRISYNYNLLGPSLSVDTACSSSLVAVHLAINSLKNGECSQAIVGGVNLILSPELTETFQKAGMMAQDGKCKTFSADADGYVRGEGCGIVILKPLEKAIANNDNILAVIHGSAINQDGRSNGLTAPSGKAQQKVIQSAWQNAGITADKINYIEAHGTGTSLGDPIELNSLNALLYSYTRKGVPILVGSAKTNIGHLEAAAGIAGLIKTVLALQHQRIPPTINFTELNPYINIDEKRLKIASESFPWQISSQPRFAGISSFGFGGTNAHVIISDEKVIGEDKATGNRQQATVDEKEKLPFIIFDEKATDNRQQATVDEKEKLPFIISDKKAEDKDKEIEKERIVNYQLSTIHYQLFTISYHLLTLSAQSKLALDDLVIRYRHFLEEKSDINFADICFTANIGRSSFKYKLGLVGKNREEILSQLSLTRKDRDINTNNQIAFIFTGQGSQYHQMGYELYQSSATFKNTVDYCEQILSQYLDKPITEILFDKENEDLLNQTIYTQPSLFVIEYALAKLWLTWGIKPAIVMGHSVGEYVAATVAGVFSLEDALKLIAYRGKLMQKLPLDGGMVCLFTNLTTAENLISQFLGKLEISVINGDTNIVISGYQTDIDKLVIEAGKKHIKSKKLSVSHGFHSFLMQPILEEFKAIAETIDYHLPRLPIVSNVTGKLIHQEIATADYWVNHIIKPVQFSQSVEYLQQENYQVFLEIGTKPILLGMTKYLLASENEDKEYLYLPSLKKETSNWQTLLTSLASLYNIDVKIDWSNFYQDYPSLKKVQLPNYPWQNQRYWLGEENNPQNLTTDWLYKTNWLKGETLPVKNHEKKSYLIFAQTESIGEKIASQLISQGNQVYLVYQGEEYQQEGNSFWLNSHEAEDYQKLWQNIQQPIDKIIYFWGLQELATTETLDLSQTNFFGCLPVIYLLQSLVITSRDSKLSLITSTSQQVTGEEKINPQGGSLWGLGKVIAVEHPEYWGGIIDIDNLSLLLDETFENKHLDRTLEDTYINDTLENLILNSDNLHDDSVNRHLDETFENKHLDRNLENHTLSNDNFDRTLENTDIDDALENPILNSDNLDRTLENTDINDTLENPILNSDNLDRTLKDTDINDTLENLTFNNQNQKDDFINRDLDRNLFWTIINNDTPENMSAIRGGNIYYPRLQKQPLFDNKNLKKISINSESSYLITGGLGALGIQCANWLIRQGAKYLILISRRQPSITIQRQLDTWQKQGVKILVANSDVSNLEDLRIVFQQITSSFPPLKGIIHSAGILADGILTTLTSEKLESVMSPKIEGAWNLHNISIELSVDFFINFSSVASLLGSAGQGNYAAANGYLDSFASYRHSLNLPALTINWGGFDVGMTESKQHSLIASGIELINVHDGINLLGELIRYPLSQLGVMKINWEKVAQKFPNLSASPYLSDIIAEIDQKTFTDKAVNNLFTELTQADSNERAILLVDYLTKAIATILNLPVAEINPDESLLDLGIDSLMVMEVINYLKTDLQLMIYPREFYDRPRISALATYLAEEFVTTHQKAKNKFLFVSSIKEENSEKKNKLPLVSSIKEGNSEEKNKLALISPIKEENSEAKSDYQLSFANPSLSIINYQLPINTHPIAFILSSPRAGSTLLRIMLAGHSDLVSPPELHLLPFVNMQDRQKELEASHLGEGLIRTLMDLKRISAPESETLVDKWVKENLSVAEVYQILQELSGNRLLVDKSPTYAIAKETLFHSEKLFQSAKYIHLIRHPYSVIESFARLRMNKLLGLSHGDSYEIGESIWQKTNQNILDFTKEIDKEKVYRVYYEELVTQPEKIMREMCDFLEVSFSESVLNPYEGERMTKGVHNQSMSVGDPNFNTRNNIDPKLANHWRKIQLPIFLNPITVNLAESFNYQLPHEEKATDNRQQVTKEENSTNKQLIIGKENSTIEMTEEFINVRGLNLCVCRWGNPKNPLIVLVHGILDQGLAWEKVAQYAAKQGYYIIAPDLRGHGKSDHVADGCSYNVLDFVADLDFLTSKITDKPFTLVGHSLGSIIAGIFANMRPNKVSKLVLVEPVLPVENNTHQDLNNIASQLNYLVSPPSLPIFPDVETVAKRLQKATPDLTFDFALKLAKRTTHGVNNGVTFSYAPLLSTRGGIVNSIPRHQYLFLLSQINIPLTIIYGDRSNFNRQEDLEAQKLAMPEGDKFIIEGGHNLHLEKPLNLAEIIINSRGNS